jgi:hypothetical protein
MGYVYAVMAFEVGRVKIGWSESLESFDTRLTALRCGSPVALGVHSIIEHRNAYLTEQHLHRRFRSARIHGEWYDINDEKVYRWLCEREKHEDPEGF